MLTQNAWRLRQFILILEPSVKRGSVKKIKIKKKE